MYFRGAFGLGGLVLVASGLININELTRFRVMFPKREIKDILQRHWPECSQIILLFLSASRDDAVGYG